MSYDDGRASENSRAEWTSLVHSNEAGVKAVGGREGGRAGSRRVRHVKDVFTRQVEGLCLSEARWPGTGCFDRHNMTVTQFTDVAHFSKIHS